MEKLINNKKNLTLILIELLTAVIGISLSFIYFDLPESVSSIGYRTFKNNQLTKVKIPINVPVESSTFDGNPRIEIIR